MSIKVSIDQSLIDELKALYGIDAVKEINDTIEQTCNDNADIVITNNGDKIEN